MEIFGQAVPTAQQNGFRHLLVEAAVLEAGGRTWRRAVRQLKKQGLKTEPAFAFLLQLTGDPYVALLELEGKSIAELLEFELIYDCCVEAHAISGPSACSSQSGVHREC